MPYPDFFLPDFALHDGKSWLEGRVADLIEASLIPIQQDRLPPALKKLNNRLIRFATASPPSYPYTRAVSAYSAQTQLLLRTRTLPTASKTSSRFKTQDNTEPDHDPMCPRCDTDIEDDQHVFELCPRAYQAKRDCSKTLLNQTKRYLNKALPDLEAMIVNSILKFAYTLIWQPEWYLLETTKMRPPTMRELPLRNRIAIEKIWHHELLKLTGRIWGSRMKEWKHKTMKWQ